MPTEERPLLPEIKPGERCYVRDLDFPPELQQDLEIICQRSGYRKTRDRQWVEDEIRLQHYFGGWDIAYLVTPNGPAVVAAGTFDTEAFIRSLSALSPSDRRAVIFHCPEPWNNQDRIATIPVPSHEV